MGFVAICGLMLKLYRHEFRIRRRIYSISGLLPLSTLPERRGGLLGGAFVVLVALLAIGIARGNHRDGLGSCRFGGTHVWPAQTTGLPSSAGLSLLPARFSWWQLFWLLAISWPGRFRRRAYADESRMAVYMITLRSIFDAPLLGYGYGTFADVFPMFRDQSVGTGG